MPRRRLIISATLCVGLGACHGKPKPPTGQVAAIVDGHEITTRQINAELNGSLPSDPKQLKAMQQRALQAIMIRTLLADKAVSEKLNKEPDYALQEQRLREGLLARLYQAQLANAIPAPSDEEAQSYIDAHPDLFSQRKIFTVDQLRMKELPPSVVKSLAPLKTVDAASSLLSANGIAFQRAQTEVDSIGVDPRLAAAFARLGHDDMLIVPEGQLLTLNAVQNARVQPFIGAQASAYAHRLLHQQSIQEAEQRDLSRLVQGAAKTIAYNPAYRPVATPEAAGIKPHPPATG